MGANKLNPPILENTLPACYRDEEGLITIKVPFSMNKSVSMSEVGGFELKIKTIQTGSYLYTFTTTNPNYYIVDDKNCYVTFQVKDNENKLKIGQFYKIQLAYISVNEIKKIQYDKELALGNITVEEYEKLIAQDSQVGFYSSASTIKYTSKPDIYINNYTSNKLNIYTHNFIGYYNQENKDITEKVYSYCFNIYDSNNNILYTSGEQIHNNTNDDTEHFGLSYDNFNLFVDLEYDTIYYIQYTVTTINNLVLSSPKYRVVQRETIDPELHASLEASLNYDNGYIILKLIPLSENLILDTGSFVLSRADEDSKFTNWEELYKFKFYQNKPEGIIYKDFTFQHGKKYKYSIQQYNDNDLYSKRILSNIILGDFEDSFLYDGKRQLKIKYNMKMSKITNTVLESKQETIGSKYPFFFRNGTVDYFEFPLGGLISYYMDEEHLFISEDSLKINEKTTNHTTDNLIQERIFKMEVLNWLNDGLPKLLRTPTEGNFIVRLMKISLTPEEKLGRLLHNFSCTAYEIAEFNSNNLRQLQLLNVIDQDLIIPQWEMIDLNNYNIHSVININTPQSAPIISMHFDNMHPGDIVKLTYKDRTIQEIYIGETGSYYLDKINLNIKSISFIQNHFAPSAKLSGLIIYNYLVKRDNSFANIQTVSYRDSVFKQFIGEHNILHEIQHIDDIPNIKSELTNISYIQVNKRPVDRLTPQNNKFYFGTKNENGEQHSECFQKVELLYPIGLRVYKPYSYYILQNNNQYVLDEREEWQPDTIYYLKGRYKPTLYPVGQIAYQKDYFYIKEEINNEINYIKDPYSEWHDGITYYEQRKSEKGQIYYTEAKYVTINENYVFTKNKFYKKGNYQKGMLNIPYVLAESFNPNYYTNHDNESYEADQYYYLDENYEEFVNAYVTVNDIYIYQPYVYYIHLFNNQTEFPEYNKDEYILNTSIEFNTHNINSENLVYGDKIEYVDGVLKYYKIKEVLPHILHQIGSEWNLNESRPGYNADLYNFEPSNYKDFYNGGKLYNLDSYNPHIKINGQEISVKDSITFGPKDLTKFGKITELYADYGVIVDIVYQTKEYEYITEQKFTEKEKYLNALENNQKAIEKLEDIDLSNIKSEYYYDYYNNTSQKAVYQAYKELNKAIYNTINQEEDKV